MEGETAQLEWLRRYVHTVASPGAQPKAVRDGHAPSAGQQVRAVGTSQLLKPCFIKHLLTNSLGCKRTQMIYGFTRAMALESILPLPLLYSVTVEGPETIFTFQHLVEMPPRRRSSQSISTNTCAKLRLRFWPTMV